VASKTAIFTNTNFGDYNATMKLIKNTAVPKSVADTLNITADLVTKQQIRNVKNDFTIRTPWTLKSMESGRARPYKALNKAMGTNLDRMFSRAGTFSPYLWMQEENTEVKGIDGPIPIATNEARTSKSRRKAIAKRNRIKVTDKLRPGKFGTGGNTFIGKPGGRRYGMYKRTNKNNKLVMLRNLETTTAKITGTHFHEKAVKKKGNDFLIAQRFKRLGQKNINKAVRRHG